MTGLADVAVRFSASRIADLERESATREGPAKDLAIALLDTARGEHLRARDRLQGLSKCFAQPLRDDWWLFENYLMCSFAAQATGSVETAIRDRFHSDWRCTICIADDQFREPVIRWEVLGSHASRFYIAPEVFRNEQRWQTLLSWVRSLSLYDYYHRSPELTPGFVDINLGDAGIVGGLAACDNRPQFFLVPDSIFLHTDAYRDRRREFEAKAPTWDSRVPHAFWRGGTTGFWDQKDWTSLPRIRLCKLAAESGGLIDAGISSVVQFSPAIAAEIELSGLMKPPVPPVHFVKFKYQIDIDGNSNSWPGLFQKLLSGSPVLKVASPAGFRQWYYDRLSPWWNYVPVESDMSDLLEKVAWLRDHDDAARSIGENGRQLASSLELHSELQLSARTITAAITAASVRGRGPWQRAGAHHAR